MVVCSMSEVFPPIYGLHRIQRFELEPLPRVQNPIEHRVETVEKLETPIVTYDRRAEILRYYNPAWIIDVLI